MGPKLNIARSFHAAGIIIDSVSKENIIVVTGGVNRFPISINSTEMLRNGTWEYGM